ncbi:DUF4158 domain-containing protein [Nonomuraea sp. CA-143628]|uniref:DUF4158 domain-containing protein n=1 Tax=Nonomuraea sp. CA-143628 TaxID=3239997 RepID=UPI003D946577
MASIERTAYPRFKRLITAREPHVFFLPSQAEAAWAAERTQSEDHHFALLVMLKSYQRMGCIPKLADVPETGWSCPRSQRWTRGPQPRAPR